MAVRYAHGSYPIDRPRVEIRLAGPTVPLDRPRDQRLSHLVHLPSSRPGPDLGLDHRSHYPGRPAGPHRQRLRAWYQEAATKAGTHRTELDPTVCFGPLLA
jgi:hypothetical protein